MDNRIDQSAVEFAAERSGEVRELLEVFPWLTPKQAAEGMGSGRADLPPALQ